MAISKKIQAPILAATVSLLFTLMALTGLLSCDENAQKEAQQQANSQYVSNLPGLVAFWDFNRSSAKGWTSWYDAHTTDQSFPLYLRQIGSEQNYSEKTWPYTEPHAKLVFDESGPFGKAVRFNQGYIYGFVPRDAFDGTLLDLHGERPFTLIAWVKFIGERHLVAGIWDEGGWQKYGGRRQVALFAGLFQQKGVIGHVSATGAASYPQSTTDGAQYARIRAIDGQAFQDEAWVSMAMTFDPEKQQVTAYLNGVMTPLELTDPVTQDVFQYPDEQAANPLSFADMIYSPRNFVLKYNGYNLAEGGISEHMLRVDLQNLSLLYEQKGLSEDTVKNNYRILFDIKRNGVSLLDQEIVTEVKDQQRINLPSDLNIELNDELQTSLEIWEHKQWRQIGTTLKYNITNGAPFTFGRALGLASEEIELGSQLYMDGVAVFNRVLQPEELKAISFVGK